jgi:hypothetical protein
MAEKKIIEIEVKTQQAVQSMDALSKSTKKLEKNLTKRQHLLKGTVMNFNRLRQEWVKPKTDFMNLQTQGKQQRKNIKTY